MVDGCHSADGGIWAGEESYNRVEHGRQAHSKIGEDVEERCGEEEGNWEMNGGRMDRMTIPSNFPQSDVHERWHVEALPVKRKCDVWNISEIYYACSRRYLVIDKKRQR